MSEYNINSNAIRIYPTASRTAEHDYGANINLEQNIVGISNNITDYNSYIIEGLDISETSNIVSVSAGKCVINGYNININQNQTISDTTLNTSNPSYVVYLEIDLRPLDNITSLNGIDDIDTGKYTGVSLNVSTSVEITNEILVLGYVNYVNSSWNIIPNDKGVKFSANKAYLELGKIGLSKTLSGLYSGTFEDWLNDYFIVDDGSFNTSTSESDNLIHIEYIDGYTLTIDPTQFNFGTTLNRNMLPNASKIKSIVIPKYFTSIDSTALAHLDNLETAYINQLNTISSNSFDSCSALKNIYLSNNLTSIGDSAFSNCSSLESIYLPKSLTSIGDDCFERTHIKNLSIPESVTSIGYRIANPNYLENVSTPIPSSSFKFPSNILGTTSIAPNLISISFTKGIIYTDIFKVGANTYDNSNIQTLYFGDGITEIQSDSLSGFTGLHSIICSAVEPPQLSANALDDTNNCPIYVPAASLSTYQTAWSDYSSRIQSIQE